MEYYTLQELKRLQELLNRKLKGIPNGTLRDITLADILNQSFNAVQLPNIPPDIQLPYLLSNRDFIDVHNATAIKDETKQSLDITRTIFFYRLDSEHQFQRYHDSFRWNVAVFLALLSLPRKGSYADGIFFPPAARRFCTTYLEAVMEHHNTPTTFTKREDSVKLWKNGTYDFFEFTASQRKLLKERMKVLKGLWEKELDRAWAGMGWEMYQWRVAKFVGSVVGSPRRDHGLHPWYRQFLGGKPKKHENSGMEMEMKNDYMEHLQGGEAEEKVTRQTGEGGRNELLEALEAPIREHVIQKEEKFDKDAAGVVAPHEAIRAVLETNPWDILPTLMDLFPPPDWRS